MTGYDYEDRYLRCARSNAQRRFVGGLLAGRQLRPVSTTLAGRAADYRGRYDEAERNLIARLKAAGLAVQFRSGPRGGFSGGHWYLHVDASTC